MRHGSLFAALRGKDGRSLARALIVLVLVNLFAGCLSAGMAAAGGSTAFCSTAPGNGDAPDAPRHDEIGCCLIGSAPFGVALATATPAVALPPSTLLGQVGPAENGGRMEEKPVRASARGPPLDA